MIDTKLASLQLQGYKTFAHETGLSFPSKVTAIVGPNGSGKSNVADAIRWVLGEQSYSLLRAKKTEDMIYSGSDNRARAGMASVSITFNNESGWLPIDYSEVVLTRRAYRDGQNEYLINNQRVRLKDFHELLAKTGLGDRTYTIIGQGLVDVALSIKPDERRKLFEEAAGIGLYRLRKEEALRRLESSQHNLERISDIVDEIRPRLRGLERQAARVGEFKLVQQNLKNNLRDWYGYHWYKAHSEIQKINEQLEIAKQDLIKTQDKRVSAKSSSDLLINQINQQKKLIVDLQAKGQAIQLDIQKTEKDKAILEERKRSISQSQAQLMIDLANLEEVVKAGKDSMAAITLEIDRINKELEDIGSQRNFLKINLDDLRKQKSSFENRKNELQQTLIDLEKEGVVIRSKKNELDERNAAILKAITNNEEIQLQLGEKNKEVSLQIELINSDLKSKLGALSHLDRELEKLEVEVAAHKQKSAENSTKLNQYNLNRNKLVNKYELLRQGKESLAGFSEGAKSVVKKLTGKGNSITDLITKLDVPEKFEKAISAALGEIVDVLVVKGSDLEEGILNEINSSAEGRVAVIGEKISKEIEIFQEMKIDGIIGYASDLVNENDEFKHIVKVLLGNFVVTEDITTAAKLRKIHNNYNFVTLNGEVFLKSGVALLGRPNQASKVSYSRISRELEEEIINLDQILIELNQEENKLQEDIKHIYQESSDFQAERKILRQDVVEIQKKLNQLELEANKILSQKRWYEKQVEENASTRQKTIAEIQSNQEKEESNNKKISQIKELLEEVKTELNNYDLDEIERQYQYLNTETQILEQSLGHSKGTLSNIKLRLANDSERFNTLKERKQSLEKHNSEINLAIDEAAAEVSNLSKNFDDLQINEILPNSTLLQKLENDYLEVSEIETSNQNHLSLREKQVTQIQMDLVRQQEKLGVLKNRIEDDFGLIELEHRQDYSRSTPLPFPDVIIETLPETVELPSDLEEEIRNQKAQLRRIGTVNLEAESEYLEVKERFESLAQQTNDLNAAIIDIHKLVKDLDEIMRKEFLDTFYAVSMEFSKMFSRLFNGGSAKLVLSDEEYPIEGGIDIEARLPGKREQGLVLLSGGERSLTAVALVFALLKISPTPFCVLDEVDAMLDESNVGRFIELLKDLSNDTQFLLITHNRNTVSAADVIYGVTMGKDSSSQVISLKLDEVDESFIK